MTKNTISLDNATKAQMAVILLASGSDQQKRDSITFLRQFVAGITIEPSHSEYLAGLFRAFDTISEFMADNYTRSDMLTEEEALQYATHRHYKGGLYRRVFEAKHTENGEVLTIYVHLYPHYISAYARPVEMFTGTLEDERLRFTPLQKE